jgi:hypothetical protein
MKRVKSAVRSFCNIATLPSSRGLPPPSSTQKCEWRSLRSRPTVIDADGVAPEGSGVEDSSLEVLFIVDGFVARAVVGVVACFILGLLVAWG